jgi:hypothetical protein
MAPRNLGNLCARRKRVFHNAGPYRPATSGVVDLNRLDLRHAYPNQTAVLSKAPRSKGYGEWAPSRFPIEWSVRSRASRRQGPPTGPALGSIVSTVSTAIALDEYARTWRGVPRPKRRVIDNGADGADGH